MRSDIVQVGDIASLEMRKRGGFGQCWHQPCSSERQAGPGRQVYYEAWELESQQVRRELPQVIDLLPSLLPRTIDRERNTHI